MQRFQKFSKKVLHKVSQNKVVASGTSLALATASQAADLTPPDFAQNITDLGILLGAMIGFGAVVWGGRKLLGFAG